MYLKDSKSTRFDKIRYYTIIRNEYGSFFQIQKYFVSTILHDY